MKRDSEFNPKTMFDFGSGVGTAVWLVCMMFCLCIFVCTNFSEEYGQPCSSAQQIFFQRHSIGLQMFKNVQTHMYAGPSKQFGPSLYTSVSVW